MAGFLSGKYQHQLDDRGRIRIPSKFKDILGKNPFVTLGTQKCLVVYSKENAERTLSEKFKDVDGLMPDPLLDPMRKMFSNGIFADEDKQGRITLQPYQIEYGDFKKNLVCIGLLNRVEIWSEECWDEYSKVINGKS